MEFDGLGIGLQEKSKSQAKEDKEEFFHIDTFMMMGAKIRKKWKWGWVKCRICLIEAGDHVFSFLSLF